MAKRDFLASVTFEFDAAAPETIRTTVAAPSVGTAARQAVKALLKAHPKRQWRSLVLVLEKP